MRRPISVRLTDGEIAELETVAQRHGVDRSELVRRALKNYLHPLTFYAPPTTTGTANTANVSYTWRTVSS